MMPEEGIGGEWERENPPSAEAGSKGWVTVSRDAVWALCWVHHVS